MSQSHPPAPLPSEAKDNVISLTTQDFPPADPVALHVETMSLRGLVHHHEDVDSFIALELAYSAFRTRKVDYMAVVKDERVIGLCSRGQIGFVLGSRFGFALYSHSPVETALVPKPLIVTHTTPVREVLDRALARRGDGFHEDVVLVDSEYRLIGLIQAETLAQLQSRLVAEQLEALRRQHETLRQQNLELFRANHAARQSQSLYLGLFEGHTLGVALLDALGGIHEHNRRLADLLGLGDASASLVSLAAWVIEKERPAFLALLGEHARGEAVATTREFTLAIPGRGQRIFRCSTGWIKETGQICACLDDITDQRTMERNILRQEKQILLDTLVGGIAHELNNKLTPVQGFAELLALDAKGDARNHIRYIEKSVGEASHIIRQLLQLSKPASQQTQLLDLRAVVDETLAMLRFQVRSAHCSVSTLLPPAAVWVQGDPGQLKQVVLNLVLNALQAMEGRTDPRLALEVRAEGMAALLAVRDNGCGIAPENLGRIFDPFFTTKGPERGTGLGLSVCFSIVRQHGGEIVVDSHPGGGTCFTVSLPHDQTTVPALFIAGDDSLSQRQLAAHDRLALVVEDDDVVRMVIQEVLRTQFGCEVDLASNGMEACALLGTRDYALVLSDIQMPLMNGAELFRHVRAKHPQLAKRFAFITGHPGGHQLEAEITQWGVPVIAKPFALARITDVCGPLLMLPH